MKQILLTTAFALTSLLGALPAAGQTNEFRDDRVTVRLLAEHRGITPGAPVSLALDFELADHWHVYWRNPGDSGEPPSVEWTLPAGFRAGEFEWPLPEAIKTGHILNYGYSHRVTLPVVIEAPAGSRAGEMLRLSGTVRWLACRAEECIPGEAELSIALPVITEVRPSETEHAPRFAEARARLPQAHHALLESDPAPERIALTLPDLRLASDAVVDFLPYESGWIAPDSSRVELRDDGDARVIMRAGERARGQTPRLAGVLVVETAGLRKGFAIDPLPAQAQSGSLALAILLALAGGMILNLMPCVFPVLSLKVLGFVEQAGADRRRVRLHGWAFTSGVLASFWLLAGTLIALRSAGQSLGWGFQLQSPAFLAALIGVLLLLGLSLSGVFEIGLSLTSAAGGRAETEQGYRGSFLTGALATIIATPCTAPFMGSALGYALTQPAAVAMLVFTALGFGMALPYLVLSYMPALLARLPRPGAWMESFRQLLAFPLYATALWLLYVFSRQTADDVVWRLMAALLMLSMAAWAWGRSQQGTGASRTPKAFACVLALAAIATATTATRDSNRQISARNDSAVAPSEFWQPWTPERVAALQASGRPAFVNFTADWCLSCQVNERVVFASASVRELFETHDVTALKADWTNEDPRIAEALAAFGRDGIPLYVFYPMGGEAPRILPQVPTHGVLRDAFAANLSDQPTAKRSDS